MPGLSAETYEDVRPQVAAATGLPIAIFPASPTPEFDRALAAALAGDDFEF